MNSDVVLATDISDAVASFIYLCLAFFSSTDFCEENLSGIGGRCIFANPSMKRRSSTLLYNHRLEFAHFVKFILLSKSPADKLCKSGLSFCENREDTHRLHLLLQPPVRQYRRLVLNLMVIKIPTRKFFEKTR